MPDAIGLSHYRVLNAKCPVTIACGPDNDQGRIVEHRTGVIGRDNGGVVNDGLHSALALPGVAFAPPNIPALPETSASGHPCQPYSTLSCGTCPGRAAPFDAVRRDTPESVLPRLGVEIPPCPLPPAALQCCLDHPRPPEDLLASSGEKWKSRPSIRLSNRPKQDAVKLWLRLGRPILKQPLKKGGACYSRNER